MPKLYTLRPTLTPQTSNQTNKQQAFNAFVDAAVAAETVAKPLRRNISVLSALVGADNVRLVSAAIQVYLN